MQFYQFPDLYFALRLPSSTFYQGVRHVIRRYLPGEPTSVMDPACGPATWLISFAKDGIRVAGNDLFPEMVEWARRTLDDYPSEIVEGDWCDLKFQTGPFDVAFEVSGICGQIQTDESMSAHWQSVLSQLRPGGLYLQHLFFEDDSLPQQLPYVCHQSPWVDVPGGGQGMITYEIINRFPQRRSERIRRTVRTQNVPNCPDQFTEEYELRGYTPSIIRRLLAELPHIELLAVHDIDDTGERELSLDEVQSEAILVLRKKA